MKTPVGIVAVTVLAFFGGFSPSMARGETKSARAPGPAAAAINALGLDLLAHTSPGRNALLSPYSIQIALAMTYAGADGGTRREMASVLHYPDDEAALHASFAALRSALATVVEKTAQSKQRGDPVTLVVANRLFGQRGYEFRAPFLNLLKNTYDAPLDLMDFRTDPSGAARQINAWVEQETHDRIRDLIPSGALDRETSLVLANAIYFKASWEAAFDAADTEPRPFHLSGGAVEDVPTMQRDGTFGYAQRDGYRVVTIPYTGGELQFLVLLPDAVDGLDAIEARVTPALLADVAAVPTARLNLEVPKLKIAPPVMNLGAPLKALGVKQAFDIPEGSANFDRMAPRRPDDYLKISNVFHKTFLDLDEKGTEAAAATAVVMVRVTSAARPVNPIEVKVDRPFLFAIQHRGSGACLFLGRVTDPR